MNAIELNLTQNRKKDIINFAEFLFALAEILDKIFHFDNDIQIHFQEVEKRERVR